MNRLARHLIRFAPVALGAAATALPLQPAAASEEGYVGTADDFAQISQLFARYGASVDAGDAQGWSSTFTEDGLFHGLGRCSVGPAQLAAVIERRAEAQRAQSPGQPPLRHLVFLGPIEYADRDHATVISSAMTVRDGTGEAGAAIAGTGTYHDKLERVDGKWLIAERRVVPPGETPQPCPDTP